MYTRWHLLIDTFAMILRANHKLIAQNWGVLLIKEFSLKKSYSQSGVFSLSVLVQYRLYGGSVFCLWAITYRVRILQYFPRYCNPTLLGQEQAETQGGDSGTRQLRWHSSASGALRCIALCKPFIAFGCGAGCSCGLQLRLGRTVSQLVLTPAGLLHPVHWCVRWAAPATERTVWPSQN